MQKDEKQLNPGVNTTCTHVGALEDPLYGGSVSPIYMSTSYRYREVDKKRYPRYFNTPNQEGLARKVAALEHTESALIFGSGMAAVSTSMLAFLGKGDHVVLSRQSYGGTQSLVKEEFAKYGIEYTFIPGTTAGEYEAAIRPNTRVLYLETPSNPLLLITDLQAVARLAQSRGLVTLIDNTFASPVNQNPADFGIDVIIHSATKYMGGHSDICAGVVATSKAYTEPIFQLAKNLGGNLSDFTVWMLERSLKTMGLRVRAQNENALQLSRFLKGHAGIKEVYYPGLEDHPGHELAREQMHGFGGMFSFELEETLDTEAFIRNLRWVKPSMSLAGVESTLTSPAETSHSLLSSEERRSANITDRLLRFSAGIEDFKDLQADLDQALRQAVRSEALGAHPK